MHIPTAFITKQAFRDGRNRKMQPNGANSAAVAPNEGQENDQVVFPVMVVSACFVFFPSLAFGSEPSKFGAPRRS
eukprot:8885516-Pyramimonas_sp.AAC.1